MVLNKLQDEQLAIVIIRLYEGEYEAVPPTLRKLLYWVSDWSSHRWPCFPGVTYSQPELARAGCGGLLLA